jgi:hypothetical protein
MVFFHTFIHLFIFYHYRSDAHGMSHYSLLITYIGCSFKFILKVGVEESIVNAPQITDQRSAVFLLCRRTSGAFTIDSSTPTLTINLNERPILIYFNIVKILFFNLRLRNL